MNMDCPFCKITPERIVTETSLTFTIRDGFPISPGHTLIISKRHFCSFFEATPEEERELMQALRDAKSQLDYEFSPMGYNIGINDGSAAGQTVPHLHIHLIPRYEGDVDDPRGGVRWIIPDKADYWKKR
ncbi:HIT family protein [bacterium]|nr:HIT family protein [bacterium]